MSVAGYAKAAAFFSGFVGLAVELAAERLLAPAFGTTLDLWSIIIALTFAALSLGYQVGGRTIDRNPDPRRVGYYLIAAGAWTFLIAFAGRSVAFAYQELTFNFGGVTLGIFLTVLTLFTVPPFLLGMITPAAIRLTVPAIDASGSSAGSVFALSTIGALTGTFTAVLLLMPFVGVRLTFISIAAIAVVGGLPPLVGFLHSDVPRSVEVADRETKSARG